MGVTRYCTRTYSQDLRIFPSPPHKLGLLVLAVLVLTFPLYANKYQLHLASVCGSAIISALGLNILTGYTGLISLGHAAFMGVGGYTAAILAATAGWPFLPSLAAGGLMSAALGVVVGVPTLRLKGLYLVVTTLAFQFITEHVIYHWESLTMSDRGISVPEPDLFGFVLGPRTYFLTVAVLAAAAAMLTKNLAMSRTGRALVAVRDRDIAAEIIGVHVAKYKIVAFVASAFLAGVGGGLYAFLVGHINPDLYTFNQSVIYVGMIIVGGMGTVLGSVLGAVFMTMLPVAINMITGPFASTYPGFASRIGGISVAVYGLVIIGFLLIEPAGLFGIWIRIKRYFQAWPFTY